MKSFLSLILATRLYLLAISPVVTFTGAAMNQVVLVANDGKFPVMISDRGAKEFGFKEDGMSDMWHTRMTKDTHFNWLADYINLQTVILSPGDLLISLGESLSFLTIVWMTLIISDRVRL